MSCLPWIACNTCLLSTARHAACVYLPGLLRRDHGSIMCRFQLYSDTRQFWDNNPDGVYKKPGACHCMATGRLCVPCCKLGPYVTMCCNQG
jgi:hypothetical protein